MAKKEESKSKVTLERTYNIPLRKEFMKAPKYKRAKKAGIALKQFLEKHMKSSDVKIGRHLNMKIWQNGIKNPPHHVNVSVKKFEDGTVMAELVGAPEEKETSKKTEEKKPAKKEETKEKAKKEETKAEKKETATTDEKKEVKAEVKEKETKTQESDKTKKEEKAEEKNKDKQEQKNEDKKPAEKKEEKKPETKE